MKNTVLKICLILLTVPPQNRKAASFFISYFISSPRRKGYRSVKLTRKVLILKNKKLALENVTLLAYLSFFFILKTWSQTQAHRKSHQVSSHISREMRCLSSHHVQYLKYIHDLPRAALFMAV